MLKKLGYIAFLMGVGILVFFVYVIIEEGMPRRWEPMLFIGGVVLLTVLQMFFVTVAIRFVDYPVFTSTGAIDEYFLSGMDEQTQVKQLPLFWKIIGWIVVVSSLFVAIAGGAFFVEVVFSFGRLDFAKVLVSLYFFTTAIASFVFSLRMVIRKWVEPVS